MHSPRPPLTRRSGQVPLRLGTAIAASRKLSHLHVPSMIPEAVAQWNRDDWSQYYAMRTTWARLGKMTLLQVEQRLLPVDAMKSLGYSSAPDWLDNPAGRCAWSGFDTARWFNMREEAGDSWRALVEGSRAPADRACGLPWPEN